MSSRTQAATALSQIAFLLERGKADRRRYLAFRTAERELHGISDETFQDLINRDEIQTLPGVGKSTGEVVNQVARGQEVSYLAKALAEAPPEQPSAVLQALRGDLHSHSDWSDGTVPINMMMTAARGIGREYQALTDHSPRLRVANGLSRERLAQQLEIVAELNSKLSDFTVLSGIEVDILADGSLDQDEDLLAEVDVVVASVHSYLRMSSAEMTPRMIAAVTHPQVNVLGHCTGRKRTIVRGKVKDRPQSEFAAKEVFAACRDHNVAVEVNSQPPRRDPPTNLLHLARDIGCVFSVDSDAHAPGELSLVDLGARRVAEANIPIERVVNAKRLNDLRDWLGS